MPFTHDLRFANSQESAGFFDAIYYRHVSGLCRIRRYDADMAKQRRGIDVELDIDDGSVVYIDEKYRRKYYGDILVEVRHEHINGHCTPGWITKGLDIDHVSYGIKPERTCYFLPYANLRHCWQLNGENWLRKYGERRSDNGQYVTVNCPIPTEILWQRLGGMRRYDISTNSEAFV